MPLEKAGPHNADCIANKAENITYYYLNHGAEEIMLLKVRVRGRKPEDEDYLLYYTNKTTLLVLSCLYSNSI